MVYKTKDKITLEQVKPLVNWTFDLDIIVNQIFLVRPNQDQKRKSIAFKGIEPKILNKKFIAFKGIEPEI